MFKNWLTTLVGGIGGALIAIQPMLQGNDINLRSVLTGFVIALIGIVSKDFNKTGS